VVLKVSAIDPQGSIKQSKGSINSHGVEWRSLNGQGLNDKTVGFYWNNEAFNSKLLLIGQGKQTAFFNKSSKIKRADQISVTTV